MLARSSETGDALWDSASYSTANRLAASALANSSLLADQLYLSTQPWFLLQVDPLMRCIYRRASGEQVSRWLWPLSPQRSDDNGRLVGRPVQQHPAQPTAH